MSQKREGELPTAKDGQTEENDTVDGENADEFDWKTYLVETNSQAAPNECFYQHPDPPINTFEVGQKLEALDPQNNAFVCVATVLAKAGAKIKLHLDGTSATNDFWILVDSPKIFVFGYTEQQKNILQPPLSYERDPVRYQTAIVKAAKESGNFAPQSCFVTPPKRPVSNTFQLNTKLEACDTCNPTVVSPATVIEKTADKIRICYDGWNFQDLIRYDCRDLFPCGWWQRSGDGADISLPPTKKRHQATPLLAAPTSTATPQSTQSANAPPRTSSEPRKKTDTGTKDEPPTPKSVNYPPARKTGTSVGTLKALKAASLAASASKSALIKAQSNCARKTIMRKLGEPLNGDDTLIPLRPPKTVNGTSSTSAKNAFESAGKIPVPDLRLSTPDKSPEAVKLCLHVNQNCHCGPHLDIRKLVSQSGCLLNGCPMNFVFRNALQLLICSATPDAGRRVFDAIPASGDGPLSVAFPESNGNITIRRLSVCITFVELCKTLRGILVSLGACPNLISVSKSCDLCEGGPQAKKPKVRDCVQVDMTRKEGLLKEDAMDIEQDKYIPIGEDPATWSIDRVTDFINSISDSQAGELFRRQEIDGRALVLLTPDMLIKYMGVRVGPAVKITNAVDRLKGTRRPRADSPQSKSSSTAPSGD